MNDLIHYSIKPVLTVKSVKQTHTPDMKPQGFWFSVEDGRGWKEWCEAEKYRLDKLACENIIQLKDKTSILQLSSCDDIDRFHHQHCATDIPSLFFINWQAVAEKFSGIIIAPYQYGRRLDRNTSWYYGWDCSCGCIWDGDAVASIKTLENNKV